MNRIFLIVLLGLACFAQGCVRFIPSRADVNRPFGDDPSIEYVGAEAFYQYDVDQAQRLENLIESRLSGDSRWETVYRIGPSDQLRIDVKNFEEISRDYVVLPDGSINLPFVGSIKVDGLSENQLLRRVRNKVSNYVIEPQVHAEVVNYSAQKVWLLGNQFTANRTPGFVGDAASTARAYPLRRPNYSLVELLVEIGDPTLLTDTRVIYLYPAGALYGSQYKSRSEVLAQTRTTTDASGVFCPSGDCSNTDVRSRDLPVSQRYHPKARIQIDVEELFGGITNPPLYVPLRPGDVIYSPPSGEVAIHGEVNQRGPIVLGGGSGSSNIGRSSGVKPSLLAAITAARGFTYGADIHNIEIYRELEFGKKVVLTVDFRNLVQRNTQDVRLRDGDIIWVPSQSDRFIEEHSINAVNQLIGTGTSVERAAVIRP